MRNNKYVLHNSVTLNPITVIEITPAMLEILERHRVLTLPTKTEIDISLVDGEQPKNLILEEIPVYFMRFNVPCGTRNFLVTDLNEEDCTDLTHALLPAQENLIVSKSEGYQLGRKAGYKDAIKAIKGKIEYIFSTIS